MSQTRLLIVVSDAEAGAAYSRAVSEAGVASDIARSFQEMSQMAKETAYNGFLVDILTLVRCSKDEKAIAYECINLFPVLRVKWEARQKKIKLSPLEQSFSPNCETALRFFLETRCKSFPARSLRRYARKPINLNLLYCAGPSFSVDKARKSFTVNLSLGGIFLHAMEPLEPGETVWLRFPEFADQTPIEATVRWSQKWGVARCIPGAGLEFGRMTDDQARQVRRILNLDPATP